MNLREWIESKRSNSKWNLNKRFWEPFVDYKAPDYDTNNELEWLCDDEGAYQIAMEMMWEEILRLRGEIE